MGRKRIAILLAGLGLAAAPALAQESAQPAASAPPTTSVPAPAPDTVGPRELRNFNLGGTVTRPAEPVAPANRPPAQTEPSNASSAPTSAAPRSQAPAQSTQPAATGTSPEPSRAASAPSAAPAITTSEPLVPTPADRVSPSLITPDFSAPAAAPTGDSGTPGWPWLLALVAALGAAGWWWTRRRAQPALAGMEFVATQPEPAPTPPPPAAPRRPVAPGGGIVARTLAPKIVLEFTPLKADTDGQGGAAVNYELTIVNAGSAPARDVLIEHLLVNAGPEQDRQIGAFFANPAGVGDRVPMIAPMGRVKVRSRVRLDAEKLRPVEVQGRKLLVPLVAFNAIYRSPAGNQHDSSSFLVGRAGTDGGKMAPMPLDRGPMSWSELGARVHSHGLNR